MVLTGAFLAAAQPATFTTFTLGLTELPDLQQVSDLVTLTKQDTGLAVLFQRPGRLSRVGSSSMRFLTRT